MKLRTKVLFILLASLFVFTTAYAYNSVSGNVIDSKNQDAWVHGGEVWVFDALTSEICGTGYLNITGDFSVPLNATQNPIGWVGVLGNCTDNGTNEITVVIDFFCSISVATQGNRGLCSGTDPDTIPDTLVATFDQNMLPINKVLANLETGSGPNAIVLSNLTAASAGANPWLAGAIVVGALALVSGGMVALRKQRK